MELMQIQHLSKVYGQGENQVRAVDDISFTVEKGEFLAIIGPSGSGKSTLLHILGGVDRPTSGKVFVDGQDVYAQNEDQLAIFRRRQVGLIYQFYNLIPVLNVVENMTLPVLMDGRQVNQERLEELLDVLGLRGREKYLPNQLSGGQQQRVGVARALAADPEVLLMDEPFGALDPVTREALQQEMLRIHRLLGRTIVLVTHDIDEALRLADHLVLMDGGEVVQQGAPLEMLLRPKNSFVQTFFGRSELGVRLLSLREVGDYLRPDERLAGEGLTVTMTLREALSQFVARRCETLPVVDAEGRPCGTLHFADLLRQEMSHEGAS